MPALVDPTTAVRASFLAAMAEFAAEGRGQSGDESMLGLDLRTRSAQWTSSDGFADYVADTVNERVTPARPGWVCCTTLWYVDGTEYLGRLAVRHELTPSLLEFGGHIGYDVRPSARRRGHRRVWPSRPSWGSTPPC